MANVDLTTAVPVNGNVLLYNGTNWVPGPGSIGGAATASPTFTGVPLAPTAPVNTNTTQLATTAFVVGQAGSATPLIDGVAAVGASLFYAREDHIHPVDTSRSPLAGSTSMTTVGTITSGTWNGTAVDIAHGGTGATTLGGTLTALGITSAGLTAIGNFAGNIPLVGIGGVIADNICTGASTGGGVSCSVANTSAGLLGLISDETGTGSLVFGTAPTFTTSLTAPLIIGGTATTQSLIYKTTTGIGTTGADHIFQVGSDGGTEAMRILNSGFVGIGNAAPTSKLQVTGGAIVSDAVANTVAYINFGAGNVQMSSTAATTINLCGLKDGGAYTLLLTGIAASSNVTVVAYPTYVNTTSCSGTAIGVDLGANATTFTTAGVSNIISFIYFANRGASGTVYGSTAINFTK